MEIDAQFERINEDIKRKYKTTESFALIEKFLQKRRERESEIGRTTTVSFERELKEKTASVLEREKEIGILAVGFCLLKNQYLFLVHVIEAKLTYLMRSMVHALNTDNHLLLALCVRSLIEHSASLCYLVHSTRTFLDNVSGSRDFRTINAKLEELRSVYVRMFYGTRFFKKEGLVDALQVGKLLDKYLASEVADIRTAYNFLSDFVHPNFGSNVLVSSGELGEGIIDPPIEDKKEIIEQVLRITATLIEYLEQKTLDFARAGIQLDDWLHRALHPSTSLSTLLIDITPEFVGDGAAKQTAIFFTNARTHLEHTSMQERYIKQFGLQIVGQRYTAAIEDGFIYDVYPTRTGTLWFKVPGGWN